MFDFSYFPVLETERLVLREMTVTDLPGVFAIFGDAETCRFFLEQDRKPYPSMEEAKKNVIDWAAGRFRDKAGLRWGLTLRGEDRLIGTAGFNHWDRRHHVASMGGDLNRTHWGEGIMTEALLALLRFGFDEMALNRVEADATEGNGASIALLSRCGFTQEGVWREKHFCDGRYFDNLQFGLLRREYASRFGEGPAYTLRGAP
jgi:ribosomal-protein-alanine N-acetyltransferase